jgi:hypothetical protein
MIRTALALAFAALVAAAVASAILKAALNHPETLARAAAMGGM